MSKRPPLPSGADSQVWVFEEHPGYRRAMEIAGTVAAPLLAGFSFALLALLVPSLGEKSTTVTTAAGSSIVTSSDSFSGLPEAAAILLLIAGLLLVASVQAAITTRYHGHTPPDLEHCYPEYFPEVDRGSPDTPPDAATLDGWNEENWPALRTATKWYPGWVRRYFYEEGWTANRWAAATRWLYHLGVLALLLGLAALVAPPADADGWRWALFSIALGGALAEAVWIAAANGKGDVFRRWTRLPRRAQAAASEPSHSE